MKKLISLFLAMAMIMGVLAGCGKDEVVETPNVPAEPTPTVYVYGVAGDMFDCFVNEVSLANMDNARSYMAIDENNNMISNDEVMKYLMSIEIGNLIYIPYMTMDITVDNSGETRNVLFKYMLADESVNSFRMKVRLVGTEWKVVVDDLVCDGAKISLPPDNYTSIEIDGVAIDMSKMKIDESGNYVYELPQIAKNVDKKVVVKAADGRYCEVTKKFYYEKNNNGVVIDDGIEKIEASDFYAVPQANPVADEGV